MPEAIEFAEAIHQRYNFCLKCRPKGISGTIGGCLRCEVVRLTGLIKELDIAMTGWGVSRIYDSATEEDIIKEAIAFITHIGI